MADLYTQGAIPVMPGGESLSSLTQAGQAAYGPDYEHQLASMVASQKSLAELAAVSDMSKQIEIAQAHQAADLATAKADKAKLDAARAQAEFETSPDYMAKRHAALTAEAEQSIVNANAVAKQEQANILAATQAGLDPSKYIVGTNPTTGKPIYNHKAMVEDTAKQHTGIMVGAQPTVNDQNQLVAPPLSTGGSLSTAPAPFNATLGAPPSATLSGAPAPSAPAAAPAASAADTASLVDTSGGVVPPPALQPAADFAPTAAQQITEARRALQIENANKALETRTKTGIYVAPAPVTQSDIIKKLGLKTADETFVDPKTKSSYEAQVARDGAGRVWMTGPAKFKKLSDTQLKVDAEMATDYQDYTTNAGASKDASDIGKLDDAIAILKDPYTFAASGRFIGLLPDKLQGVVQSFQSDKSKLAPQLIQTVVQNHLKELFGARMSNLEVQGAMKNIFNKSLDEKTNAGLAETLRKRLVDGLENKRDAFKYFEAHGTMAGYKSSQLDANPGSTSTSSSTAPLTTKASAPKAVEGAEGFTPSGVPIKVVKYPDGTLHWVNK